MNLRLKYRDSVFGFLWSLANPTLLILVYTVAFKYILRVATPNYTFFLLVGVLPWIFFATSLSMSTGSIIDNSSLIKKVSFPRSVLPVAIVLFALAQYILTLVVFLPSAVIFFGVTLTWRMLLFLPILALQVFFTIGLALLLSAGTVLLRDIRHFVEILLMLLFWLTPIIYEVSHIPTSLRPLITLSPLAPFIVAYQQIFYYSILPSPLICVQAAAYAAASLAVGFAVFQFFAPRFAEEV